MGEQLSKKAAAIEPMQGVGPSAYLAHLNCFLRFPRFCACRSFLRQIEECLMDSNRLATPQGTLAAHSKSNKGFQLVLSNAAAEARPGLRRRMGRRYGPSAN